MKLFADANIESALVERLRTAGHDVASAKELDRSADDDVLLAKAREESRVFLTNDLHFGELAVRRGLLNCGVVILRLSPLSLRSRIERACEALAVLPPPPVGVLWVIEPARERRHIT